MHPRQDCGCRVAGPSIAGHRRAPRIAAGPGLELLPLLRCPIGMGFRSAFAVATLVTTLSATTLGAQTTSATVPGRTSVAGKTAAAGQAAAPGQTGPGQTAPGQTGPGQTTVALSPALLPASFGAYAASTDTANLPAAPPFSLAQANKAALEECEPEQSSVKTYSNGSRRFTVEAVEFKDASGALAAASIVGQPNMREVKNLGTLALAGDGGVVFVTGAAAAVVFPATAADLPILQSLAAVMPKPVGSKGLQPLLPSLLPNRGLLPGSMRYALGPRSYMADGGVLPGAGLGWDKEAEAVTARYNDRRGTETLTLLLYPTPTIAAAHGRAVDALLHGLGSSFANAKTRREGSLLAVANGSFSPEATQALVENTHLRQILSTDKAMPTPDVVETRKTFGLLANVILFSGVLGLAALLLALFLGGGRALVRILRGKPAATEAEFLSLHLDPQNAAPQFSLGKPGEGL